MNKQTFKRTVLAIFGILALTSCFFTLDSIILRESYGPIRPPVQGSYKPGSIVALEGQGILRSICTDKESLGSNFTQNPVRSASQSFKDAVEGRLGVNFDFIENIKLNGESKLINKVTIKITDAMIYDISESIIRENISNRSKNCTDSVMSNLKLGSNITMINSTLEATVEYEVEWVNEFIKLSLDSQKELEDLVGTRLSANAVISQSGKSIYSGSSLVLGVRDFVRYAEIGVLSEDELNEKWKKPNLVYYILYRPLR
jgi:hypothetical protein